MKIFLLCGLLAVACAYPTGETQTKTNDEHHDVKSPVETAYEHRPLVHQQIPVKTTPAHVADHKLKRDVVGDHLPSVHDNAPPSFVKPVPVEQILGKVNQDAHPAVAPAKVEQKPADQKPAEPKPAEHKPEVTPAVKPEVPKPATAPVVKPEAPKPETQATEALLNAEANHKVDDKKPASHLTAPKSSEESSESSESDEKKKHDDKAKPAADRKTRETPKTVNAKPEPVVNNKPEQNGHQAPVQTLPIKVSANPRATRDTHSLEVLPADPPKADAVPFNPNKPQEPIVHTHEPKEVSRVVRDAPKDQAHTAHGPTPVPHHEQKADVKPTTNVSRVARDAPKDQAHGPTPVPHQDQKAQVKPTTHDLKGAEVSRLVRDAPKPEAHAVNGPTSVPHHDQKAQVKPTTHDLKGAEVSRLVRDAPKPEAYAVNGPTPVPQQKPDVKHTEKDTVHAEKLH